MRGVLKRVINSGFLFIGIDQALNESLRPVFTPPPLHMHLCVLCEIVPLETCAAHRGGLQILQLLEEELQLDVPRRVALLRLSPTSLFRSCSRCYRCVLFFPLIFFAQWSDLACSEWLVSPSGDVGLNSRV